MLTFPLFMSSIPFSPKLIFWGFFLFSIVIFNLITYLMSTGVIAYDPIFGPSTKEGDLLFYIFAGVSVVVLVAQFPLTNFIVARSNNLFGKDFTASVVRCALSESIVVYGFMIFLLTGVIEKMWLFSGVGFLSLAAAYPREKNDDTVSGSPAMPQKF